MKSFSQKTFFAASTYFICLLCLVIFSAGQAFAQPKFPAGDFDIRAPREMTLSRPKLALLPEQAQALENLSKEATGEMDVKWSSLTGAPSRIHRRGRSLTPAKSGNAQGLLTAFLNRYRKLFNLSPEDIREHRFSRNFRSSNNGVSHIALQQQVNGIDVFGGEIKVNIDSTGQILNVSGEPLPNIRNIVDASTPTITDSAALLNAATAAGINSSTELMSSQLVYFPLTGTDARLSWKVTFEDTSSTNMYESIVDASDGTVLWRKALTHYDHIPTHGEVYTSDSPIPNTPKGTSTGTVSREDKLFSGGANFPHDDDRYDWWNGAARTTTTSNNVDAYADRDGNNAADAGGRPTAGGGESFTFPVDLTDPPANYQDAAVANLFYWNNRLHDFFYRLGFDEASGNFQSDNFGLGGSGGDRVMAEAQDNADGSPRSLCNANMGTPGDGSSPRMQMYVCDRSSPDRDGDFETTVIAHEYTHGVHSRLVPTSGNQVANEGWCDYFGLAVVAEEGDNYAGMYGIGDYLFNLAGDGIRTFPYSTNLSIFNLTYADLNGAAACAVKTCSSDDTETCNEDADCSTSGDTCDGTVCQYHEDCQPPNTTIPQGLCRTSVYRTGEIWANTLLLARFNLAEKFGFNSGHNTMNRLVIDGMKLSPDNPTLLDGRDAILAADLANNGGANECLIWDAFAKMGMGYSALTTGVDDINPLEGYDVPTYCSPVIQVNAPSSIGDVCVGSSASRALEIFNTGAGDLIVTSVARLSGSSAISVNSIPSRPVFIGPDSHVDFTVTCAPLASGSLSATIRIESNDSANPVTDLVYTCNGGQPKIVTTFDETFENVCLGDKATHDLIIQNSGACNLQVSNITSSNSEFKLASVVSLPLNIAPATEITVPVEFAPTGDTTSESSTISITHNGANTASPKTLVASGVSEDAVISTFVANAGAMGEVCSGSFVDTNLSIQNNGPCPLQIDGVTIALGANSQAGDFEVPSSGVVGSIIEPGNSAVVPIRFSPSAFDSDPPLARQASVEVASRTKLASSTLAPVAKGVSGIVPPPDINVAIANSGDFGKVCKGDHADLDLTLFNQGKCDLTISDISFVPDAGSFELPSDITFPLVLSHDADFTLPVRYSPEECSSEVENRTIELDSDDPDEPTVSVDVSGSSPCPNLVIDPTELAGLFSFPATVVDTTGTLGCYSERTVTLRNNGECPLKIDSISAVGSVNAGDFSVTQPSQFPVILPSGEETLLTTVRFTPKADAFPLAPTELGGVLTVVSDDPDGNAVANLCGEGVTQSGVRILVTDISSGTPVPVANVDEITLRSKGIHKPSPINLSFSNQPVSSSTLCGNEVLYHVDQETLPATKTTGSNPISSYQAKARDGNLQAAQDFTLGQCEFRQFQLQLQDSNAGGCLLLPKGAACASDGECCSGRCQGSAGNKTCK